MLQNNIPDIDTLLLGLWGDIKTAKTSFACSAPGPVFHMDLDQGFARAASRLSHHDIQYTTDPLLSWLNTAQLREDTIISKPYQMPILFPGQPVTGAIAMQETVIADYGAALMSPSIRTIVVDTGTVMWTLVTNSQLERIQRGNSERVRLQQIEYARPNSELRALYGAATTYHKSLIITHHVGGIYQDSLTGNSVRIGDTWAGFGGMGAIVDMVARTGIDRTNGAITPMLQVKTCGYTLALEDQMLSFPDDDIKNAFQIVLDMINAYRRAGI